MHTQSFGVNIIKFERLSAKVLQICLRHRHLWLGNRNLHLCPTNWLVIVILTSSIRYVLMSSSTFIMIIIRLLTTFSWQTALLILGGICMGNCVFALFFKPIPECKVGQIMTKFWSKSWKNFGRLIANFITMMPIGSWGWDLPDYVACRGVDVLWKF